MGFLTDIKARAQEIPIPELLKGKFPAALRKRNDADIEREELLVRIEVLTARCQELMEIADLNPDNDADDLTDQEVHILKYLADDFEVSGREVAEKFGYKLARAEYLLARMMENGYLVDSVLLGRHSYLLDNRGRQYLLNHGFDPQP